MSLRAALPLKGEKGLRWRGGDVSRLENLSDIVFGFALTLLVVSAAPPTSFEDLKRLLWEFPGFLAAFALLLLIWNAHYLFFRRYGIEDAVTTALNAALLFLILFFIYPLKFLASMLSTWIGLMVGADVGAATASLPEAQRALIWFAVGYAGVFALIAMLFAYAAGKARALGLDAHERAQTWAAVFEHCVHAGVATIVAIVAGLAESSIAPFAGFIFFAVGPLIGLAHVLSANPKTAAQEAAPGGSA